VIANGLRAFGTIYAAWWTSVERATGMDHIVYGWFFFAAVMAAVLAIGWKGFDRDPDAAWFDPAGLQAPVRHPIAAPAAALLGLGLAGAFLGWSSLIAARAAPLPATIALPEVAGWHRVSMRTAAIWSPHFPGADHFLIGRYADAQGRAVDLAVAVYAAQHEGKELVGFGIGAIRENDRWVRIEDLPDFSAGHALRMIGPARVERETVSWYRVGDTLTGSDNRVKLETLKTKLLGGNQAAMAILLSAEQGPDRRGHAAIEDFLKAIGPIDGLADRIAGSR
jgi:EpsI family protein